MLTKPEALLCTTNFPANTGYAWDFIEGIYAALADKLAEDGIETWVAYPRVDEPPAILKGSSAKPAELNTSLRSFSSLIQTIIFIKRNNIKAIYFTDRASRSLMYLVLRWAGIKAIIVHDHTSGARDVPVGMRLAAKKMFAIVPGFCADIVFAVSDFVARRQKQVALIPPERVIRIWNSMAMPELGPAHISRETSKSLGAPTDGTLFVCACRATRVKGVTHLLRAFDSVLTTLSAVSKKPFLIYVGDGPHFDELRALHQSLKNKQRILLVGYKSNARAIVAEADVCVVPSLWEEAFGLAVLEGMAYEKPVIASRVGGIPEMLIHKKSGLLVEPGDEEALAEAMRMLTDQPELAKEMGRNGRKRAIELFSPQDKINQISKIIRTSITGAGSS